MSAQEFKPGDTVRFTDLNRAVGSPFWPGAVYTVNYVRQDGMVSIRGIDKPALAKHFEKVEHAEPEDKDDLYVEPEPLKEGDWVQVWAQVEDEQYINTESNVLLSVVDAGGGPGNVWARYDAIVRPSAGQVPPWVKPIEEPTGLGAVVSATLPHGAVGVTMVRYATWDEHKRPWQAQGGSTGFSWDQMTDVTVLSEGWADGGAS